jgi:hypothetical protein
MTDQKANDRKFNETLKRMLETPPKPHDKNKKETEPKRQKIKIPKRRVGNP